MLIIDKCALKILFFSTLRPLAHHIGGRNSSSSAISKLHKKIGPASGKNGNGCRVL